MEYQDIGITESQRSQGFQRILSAEMLQRANQATTLEQRKKVKDEFLAIFYKELLKQAFTPPKFGVGEENNSFTTTFGQDILVEKLALDLAQSKSFSGENLFPPVVEREMQGR